MENSLHPTAASLRFIPANHIQVGPQPLPNPKNVLSLSLTCDWPSCYRLWDVATPHRPPSPPPSLFLGSLQYNCFHNKKHWMEEGKAFLSLVFKHHVTFYMRMCKSREWQAGRERAEDAEQGEVKSNFTTFEQWQQDPGRKTGDRNLAQTQHPTVGPPISDSNHQRHRKV